MKYTRKKKTGNNELFKINELIIFLNLPNF